MNNREDIEFLLHQANPEEFDLIGALEAYHNLMDVYLDMNFQLMASEVDFKGPDKAAWTLKIQYKSNRVLEAAKKFSRRYRELKEGGAQAKISKITSLLNRASQSSESFLFAVKEILNG